MYKYESICYIALPIKGELVLGANANRVEQIIKWSGIEWNIGKSFNHKYTNVYMSVVLPCR